MTFAQTRVLLGGGSGFSLLAPVEECSQFIKGPCEATVDADRANGAVLKAGPLTQCLLRPVKSFCGFGCGNSFTQLVE